MDHSKATWIPFWVLLVILIMGTMLIHNVNAEKDCLDYSIESGEPVVLIGVHPFFYGPIEYDVNHYMNYEIIDNNTIQFNDYMYNKTWIMSTKAWEEIRPGVYSDGFNFFKLFIYREPQRYWRKMI